jgi:hypothetical protein
MVVSEEALSNQIDVIAILKQAAAERAKKLASNKQPRRNKLFIYKPPLAELKMLEREKE